MKKATKRLLTILAFALGLSYFAFTLVFFDPFEGSYMDEFEESPIALEFVVPRNVDFFAHKRSLENDFDSIGFPVPRAWDQVELSRNWQRFERTPLYQELADGLDLGKKIEEIRSALGQVPVLDPLSDIVGRDAAVFGRLAGRGFEETEVTVVFLGSALCKFAYSVVGYDMLRSLAGAPFDLVEDDFGVRCLTVADGTQLYLYRHLDLFVVGTGPLLVQEVVDLIAMGREGSLGRKHLYSATVAQKDVKEFAGVATNIQEVFEQVDERLQLHCNLPSMFSLAGFDEDFLEHRGQVSRWILARLFNPRYYRDFSLDIGFGDSLDIRGMIEFDRDAAESAESGFYDRRTFNLREAMDRVAGLLPEDVFFVMAARVDMHKFLPKIVKGLTEVDPAARELLDGLIGSIRGFRSDFQATNAMDAARHLSSLLGQDVVVALKRDTYWGAPDDPSPLIALFFQVKDRGPSFEELEKTQRDPSKATGYNGFIFPIMAANARLRQEGRGVSKWYKVWHEVQGSPEERFVQDVVLVGTDIKNVSFGIIDPKSKSEGPWTLAVVLSPRTVEVDRIEDGKTYKEGRGTAHELITDIIKLSLPSPKPGQYRRARDGHTGIDREIRPLLESQKYQQGSDFLQGFASVAVYLDAVRWKEVLLDRSVAYSQEAAELTTEEWQAESRRIKQELLDGEFSSWRGKQMPKAVQDRFDQAVEQTKEEVDHERRTTVAAEIQRRYEQNLAWLDLFKDAFVAARIDSDRQGIEIRARIQTDID